MEHLPIQTPFGDPGIGLIGEGTGFGFQAIGRDVQGPMPIGCLAIGNPEEEVGSGSMAIGSTDSSNEFGVKNMTKKKLLINFCFFAPNSELRTKYC